MTTLAVGSDHVYNKNVLSPEPKKCAKFQLNRLEGTRLKFSCKI